MSKSNDSFYRYLWLKCEISLSKGVHVKQFSHLCNRRYTLKSKNYQRLLPTIKSVEQSYQTSWFYSKKKKFGPKQNPLISNELKKSWQMSDSLQPTLNHVSYGGQFDISESEGNQGSSELCTWRKRGGGGGGDSSSGRGGRQPLHIPDNFRVWETVGSRNDKFEGPSFKFKIASYNVLAQYLLECHPYLYTDCHPYNLKWRVRSARLFEEIMQLAPDILCLQEVQASHLSTFYERFVKNGYFGLYKQKTGQRHDGCAIYFKHSQFHILDHVTVEYYQPELPILNRDNIGIMVKLVPKSSPTTPFVVATTHLLYNPKRTDVRLAQMQVLLAEIDRFAYYSNSRDSGHLPIILTGDFNSQIDSAVVELVECGQVNVGQFRGSSDWRRIEVTDNCQHLSVYLSRQRGDYKTDFSETKIYNSQYCSSSKEENKSETAVGSEHTQLFNTGVVGHLLKLTSVYEKFKRNGENEATTFQDFWLTVDYIYFSRCSRLNLVERLRLPTAGECAALGCLPNDKYASDHLMLAALFELRLNKCNL